VSACSREKRRSGVAGKLSSLRRAGGSTEIQNERIGALLEQAFGGN